MNDQEAFEVWYKAYPKKRARGDAIKAWNQTKKDRPALEEMLKVLAAQCQMEEWRKASGQFIPYPATYLRGQYFFDEVDVALPEIVNGQPWHETWGGIVAKGKEFGLFETQFDFPYQFKAAVFAAAEKQKQPGVVVDLFKRMA